MAGEVIEAEGTLKESPRMGTDMSRRSFLLDFWSRGNSLHGTSKQVLLRGMRQE